MFSIINVTLPFFGRAVACLNITGEGCRERITTLRRKFDFQTSPSVSECHIPAAAQDLRLILGLR